MVPSEGAWELEATIFSEFCESLDSGKRRVFNISEFSVDGSEVVSADVAKVVEFRSCVGRFSGFPEFWSISVKFSELEAEKFSEVFEVILKLRAVDNEEISIVGRDCKKNRSSHRGIFFF